MPSLLSLSVALALLEPLAHASLIHLPRATSVTEKVDANGWSPRPTASPLLPPELLRRVYLTNAAQYVLIAPDRTCGYISGSAGADFACPSSSQSCVFFPVTGASSFGAVGCCTSIDSCYIRTKCIDSKSYSVSSACDDACRFDANTLKCTASASPYCGSIRYPQASVQDYYCDSVSRSTWLLASTTYNGETGRTLSSSIIQLDSTTATLSSTSSVSSGSATLTAGSSTTTTPAGTTLSPAAKSPIPVGAIVGGVLGGIAVIGLFALAALFILKKYGRKPHSPEPSQIGLNDHDNGPPPQPIEIGETWRAAAPSEYYKPQSQSFNAQYQPIIAEMAAPEEYVYVEKPAREVVPVPFHLGSPTPNGASVAVSPASTANRNSMGMPDFTRSPDLRHGQSG